MNVSIALAATCASALVWANPSWSQSAENPFKDKAIKVIGIYDGTNPDIERLFQEGIDLNTDTRLLHLICKLLLDAVGQSDWDLKLAIDADFVTQVSNERVPPHKLN